MNKQLHYAVLPAADGQPEILTDHGAVFQEALNGAARIVECWLAEPGQQSLLALQEEWLHRTPASAQSAFRDGMLRRLEQRLRACHAAAHAAPVLTLSAEPAQADEGDGHLAPSCPCQSGTNLSNRPARQLRHSQQLAGLALRLMLFTGTSAAPLLRAQWAEIDLEGQVWHQPNGPLPTPLPDQAVGVLLELQAFTQRREGPVINASELTPELLQVFLDQLGYAEQSGRTPRQMVRDELTASGRFGPALIAQHFDAAHGRARFELGEQAAMLQAWANHLSDACAVAVPSYRQLSKALRQAEGWRYE
ncbi:hypothetical protein GFM12_06860 [Pseudomonas aeruginosa]|uniref:hypothetical protein n=1 Tax=Pseudomonas aeruginosa TaxID=287 RepID=UPI00190D6755|nr:hypothetical protein [Pseudomonas aeruginosa]MBK3752265.1 hypothetical protein [Pseudomonas aeruginosa]MBK3762503.1 hypothetical protein [Pseudomonas aeruginosa]MBK3769043.1 hypothetical protein [Pseudomonas aeruginosa]MBK3789231.1 hypothetical protein [Pseudomonas aeruginosa]MBK3885277.1 hypothetical protein [Pseudomonas aeruginosa]